MLFALRRRLKNFQCRPLRQRYTFPLAWMLLGISRALVLLVPFRLLAPRLGKACGRQAYSHLLTPHQRERALEIGRTIRWAAKHTPWNANCFAQAITARTLLGLAGLPYAIYFGLVRDEQANLQAHAWVAAGPIRVTGGNGFANFTVVGCFIAAHKENA